MKLTDTQKNMFRELMMLTDKPKYPTAQPGVDSYGNGLMIETVWLVGGVYVTNYIYDDGATVWWIDDNNKDLYEKEFNYMHIPVEIDDCLTEMGKRVKVQIPTRTVDEWLDHFESVDLDA